MNYFKFIFLFSIFSIVNAGPIALSACCATTCGITATMLVNPPAFFYCLSACIESFGVITVPPFMCVGANYAPA
jgi:hypothetical protein